MPAAAELSHLRVSSNLVHLEFGAPHVLTSGWATPMSSPDVQPFSGRDDRVGMGMGRGWAEGREGGRRGLPEALQAVQVSRSKPVASLEMVKSSVHSMFRLLHTCH